MKISSSNLVLITLLFVSFSKGFDGPKPWGVYQIFWGQLSYEEGLRQQIQILQGKPKYVMFFRDLIRPFPKEIIVNNDKLGLTTIISLELTIWGRGSKTPYLEDVISGKYDAYFISWAKEAAQYAKPVIYRFGFEMNGKWFSWGGQPELFKKAWNHVHQIFVREKAINVQWMFCPSILWGTKTAEADLFPYYPGDETVDLVGLDGYNFGDNHDRWHKWSGYEQVFEKSIEVMHKTYSKPLFIGEIGCADDDRKSAWLQDFLERVTRDDRVEAFIYFNYDKSSEKEPNWRIESDANSLNVFRSWLQKK